MLQVPELWCSLTTLLKLCVTWSVCVCVCVSALKFAESFVLVLFHFVCVSKSSKSSGSPPSSNRTQLKAISSLHNTHTHTHTHTHTQKRTYDRTGSMMRWTLAQYLTRAREHTRPAAAVIIRSSAWVCVCWHSTHSWADSVCVCTHWVVYTIMAEYTHTVWTMGSVFFFFFICQLKGIVGNEVLIIETY